MRKLNKRSLLSGKFGLEKENTRVDANGHLSQESHPAIFSATNPFITRDFSEAQIEMITPPLPTIKQMYNFMYEIEKTVVNAIGKEFLWPQSNPPILPDDNLIPVAQGGDEVRGKYKQYLSEKYGTKKSIISGIHFNLSFSKEFLQDAYEKDGYPGSFIEFEKFTYLKVAKYFMKYRWMFIYLLSASPTFHKSYVNRCVATASVNSAGDCKVEGMQSLRNSVCGYRNKEHLVLDYTSSYSYEESIQQYIENDTLKQKSELYTAIRMKGDQENAPYIEMRLLDINPLFINGVSIEDLEMLHLFAVFFSQQDDFNLTEEEQMIAWENQDRVSIMKDETPILSRKRTAQTIKQASIPLFKDFESFYNQYKDLTYNVKEILDTMYQKVNDRKSTYAYHISKLIEESNYIDFHLSQAKKFKEQMENSSFTFKGYEGMELSTQILMQATILRGLEFEVLDENENFIRIVHPETKQVEYIKSATKTSKDKYSQVLVMENKEITKKILTENEIHVPYGFVVHDLEDALDLYDSRLLPNKIVIKPNTTNFGEGITIFTSEYSEDEFTTAVQFAFEKDSTVLLEEFLEGKEYRILVIGEEVVGILHRRAANVIGDGIHSIQELVNIKNKSTLRGVGYKTPLEIIHIGSSEALHLKRNGLTSSYIPAQGEFVFLRENSNISTGGDSIDFTDDIDKSYKEIAIKAAKALDVSISGVDMLIEDFLEPANDINYGIIEVNFNPAIHIHCFPYQGINRQVGIKILDYLFV